MNIIKVSVKFESGKIFKKGINLITNDYNSTKIKFDFDKDGGTKIFKLKNPNGEVIFVDEIVNDEIILARFDEHQTAYPIFNEAGEYKFEISLYQNNSKLTSTSSYLKVVQEEIVIDGEIVETYTPMFDNLLSDLAGALEETENLDIDATKSESGSVSTVTITNKEGITKSVEIVDGAKGDKGADAKINGVNTLTIEAGTNISLDQEGNILTINSTGGTFSYTDLTNKPSINNVTLSGNKSLNDLGIQPKGDYALESDIPDVSSFITKDVNNLTNYTLKTNTGSLIDLEINDTTYVVTLKLKNQDGTIISTDTIDLPLESVVVSGRYDNTTKKVILTLENGSEVDFSVADLVAGLQTEITSSNKLASDLVDDTNSGNKFVTTSEKQTWNNKYDKPNGGVPKTDLASTVQTSLNKADTAIQEHQDISGKEDKTNKVTSIDNTSTDTQYPSAKCVHDSQATQDDEIETLQTENARLKSTIPTTTGSGEEVTLEKTTELDFVKPPLPRGNTKQNTTTGKNLLNTSNVDTTTVNGVTSYRSNGVYYLSGTNTKTDATWVLPNTQNTNLPTFEIGQTYTMSFKGTIPNGVYAQLNAVKASTGTQYSIGSVRNTVSSLTFTIDSDYSSTAQLFIGVQGVATNVDCNFAIQIEKGSTATSYEPYTGGIPSPNPSYPQVIRNVTGNVEVVVSNSDNTKQQAFTFPLGNEKLMIGDYLADDGIHHLRKQIVLNGSENWTAHGSIASWFFWDGVTDGFVDNTISGYALSNYFTQKPYSTVTSLNNGEFAYGQVAGSTRKRFVIKDTDYTTVADFKTWLSTNNVTIEYELANEEITPYTAEQQQVYNLIKKALSYEEQTNISGSSDESNPLFDVEAYQDLKIILTNYVTFDNFATSTTTGVVITNSNFGVSTSSYTKNITAVTKTYAQYQNGNAAMFVGKGTLENVITGKELDLKQLSTFDSTKTQVLKNINGTLTWVNE